MPDCFDSTFFLNFIRFATTILEKKIAANVNSPRLFSYKAKQARQNRYIPPSSSHKTKQARFTCNISPSLWQGVKQACDKCNISRSPGKIGESSDNSKLKSEESYNRRLVLNTSLHHRMVKLRKSVELDRRTVHLHQLYQIPTAFALLWCKSV